MNRLNKRVALVTGASRGLGAAIATALAEEGAKVAINYFASSAKANDLAIELRSRGLQAESFKADVRDEVQVAAMLAEVERAFGAIDIVVANATGPQPMLPIEEQTWQIYLDQMEFFVKSPLLLMKKTLAGMREGGYGRFINIGSEVVELGNPRFASYVAAKAAQLGMTRSWARELGSTGITVNLVAPGWIPTERHVDADAAEMDRYIAGVPMQKMGMPGDVARAVVYLASDDAAFVTGQKISVNGGNTLE